MKQRWAGLVETGPPFFFFATTGVKGLGVSFRHHAAEGLTHPVTLTGRGVSAVGIGPPSHTLSVK